MTAAPYKVILKFATEKGTTFQYPCTASDVNGEYYIFPDGSSDLTLPSEEGAVYLVDVILSAAGTDTSQAEIFANQKSTGVKILNAANLTTAISRQFQGNPIGFKRATRIKIKQLT